MLPDSDGELELVIGYTDRVVQAYRWQDKPATPEVSLSPFPKSLALFSWLRSPNFMFFYSSIGVYRGTWDPTG